MFQTFGSNPHLPRNILKPPPPKHANHLHEIANGHAEQHEIMKAPPGDLRELRGDQGSDERARPEETVSESQKGFAREEGEDAGGLCVD
jgi:hypothetical protein